MLEDWARIKSVLEEALAREGRDRSAFLAEACGSDAVLRQRVDALLASHGATETFLETPAISILDLSRRGEDLSGRTVGAYRLVARIGAGAMGDVYEAHDQKLDRRVAIKLIAKHLAGDSNRLRRFSHEARAASSLNHPNIVVVHDFGELDDRPFIVTEFVEGETLRARIKRGPVAVSDAVAIALQVAGALAAAHARELVHRDIKPENVMVRPDGYIKIVDFGLAKLARVERVAGAATFDTQPGQMAGTPCYMSPEQARGLDVDASTDTWSLGALLYEMIAGRPPFQGLTTADVLAAVLTAEPLPLEAIAGHTPAVVSQLVEKALRKERSERYPHASAIAAELAAIKKQLDTATTVPPMRASGPDADEIVLQAAGERRRGTVLVSLVSGYASLVERLAPAHVDRIVAQLRAASADTVRRHGGIVNQTIGEQIVSLFGIPTAHEDDDLRAVRAALELHARAREIGDAVASSTGIHVRIQSGLHAGSVVVQKVRDGTRRYGVTGAPIEIASRLSSAAEPDSILVSAELQRVVAPFVRTEPHALVRVRADEDVATHTLTGESGVDSRLAAAERVGLTPYTGRANELTTLEGEVDHGRRGEGRLVLVVGEAGSGKSRLLHELRSRVAGTNLRIFQGRCRSYGASAYLPFVQALRALIGLGEYESGERPVSDIAARIRAVEPSLEPFIPLYLHLLSRESDEFVVPRHLRGEHFAAAMHDALAAIFTSYAQQTPVLLLLEDWHWADDASRDALRQLGEVVGGYPLAIVVTSRPEAGVLETVPEPRTRINLIPLNAPASLAIVKALLGTERIPEELGRRLHDRTSGNPFFLEEMCHALREAGVVAARGAELVILDPAEGLDLPDSVQAVIRSRIDRLNPDAREALRVAAVIGREFTRSLLSDVLGIDPADPIERLKSAGLVQQTRIVPDARYRFKHVLTQEVAYDSLLEHQRKTLQLAVGRALERAHRDDADRPLELLAYHFSRGEAWPEAIAYGERAADRANALSEFADALTLLERVQSWLMRLDDTSDRRDRLADVLLKQERACETLGLRSRQQQLSAELVALLAPHGASARLAEAYLRQGDVSTLLKRFDVADRALATALRMSREHADAALERRTLRSIGLLRWHEGRHTEALAITERALAIDRERGDELAVAGDLSNIVPILRSLGQHERALACLEEALAIPALADDPIRLQYLLHNTANVHRSLGNLTAALAYLERADEGARLHMLPIQRSFHLTAIAHIRLQQGRLEESLRLYQEAVELSRRSRHADGLAQSLRMLGELLYSIGREEESLPHLQEAAHLFAQLEDRGAEASMWRYVALVRERSGRDDVSAAWQHARERAQAAGDATAELDAAEGIARATRRVAASEAIGRYEEALALAARAGDRLREAALVNTLGILEFERQEYAAALRHYESGLAMARTRNDRGHEGLTLNSIGVTLARLQRYEEARTALEEALAVNRESGQRLLQSHTLAALGDIAQTLGRFDTAVEYFESALAIRRELDDRVGQGWMLHRLSRTRALMGDRDAAAELGRAAAQIAAQCGDAALGRACGVTGEDAKAAVQS